MKNYILFLIFLSVNGFSQDTIKPSTKLDSIKKYELIYTYITETKTFTKYETQSGEKKGSTSTRGIFIDFKVGEDGRIQNIGRKGRNLMLILKSDTEAYAELQRAYKVHLRKKRICNTLEYVGYAITLASAAFLFVGLDNYEVDGVNGFLIGGGIGVVAGITDIVGFYILTEKHMDAFSKSIQKSISIYNKNKLTINKL